MSTITDQTSAESDSGCTEDGSKLSSDTVVYPSKKELLACIPEECFERSLLRSSLFMVSSVILTVGPGILAYLYLPMTLAYLPAWIAYALFAGTAGTGCWVVAHECGHRAYCKQNWIQDAVGFILHSSLLVPYFSWQRSHALHHARTNHLDLGETFVPDRAGTPAGKTWMKWQSAVGDEAFAVLMMFARFSVGWPVYLMTGASGGPARGKTNHFWPAKPFSDAMFPGKWRRKVWYSDIGVLATLGLLGWWAYAEGSILPVLAIYLGPYLVVNFWLVLYTWLQHTAEDVPHFENDEWSWVKGAFMTIDRPYGMVLDFLHHRIGSTHVAHHIDARIPHYNAKKATEAIKTAYPDLYLYDPDPIPKALWKVALNCNVVSRDDDGGWRYKTKNNSSQVS